jgi:hypothetical protein
MDIQLEVGYLEGFLKAIEIAAGRRARIAANWYASNENPVDGLAAFFREREIAFGGLEGSIVSREDFLSEVWKFSTDLMVGTSASVLKDLKWQFEEYLGLISSNLGQDHPFHPLFHCQLYRVLIQGKPGELVLLIQFEQTVVALFLETRA